jgi:hypothetical protein
MSAGPLSEYAGISGVADSGGDSLTEDFNIYYSVRTHSTLCSRGPVPVSVTNRFLRSPAISHGS